ncbi:MAG: hypothetical protein ABWZ01_04845, partial [Methyloceanibacter sp.]
TAFDDNAVGQSLRRHQQCDAHLHRPVFPLNDQLDDVWGEVSAGVNFFNFGTGTTVFAKVDVTFGDDLSGVGRKAGMRVAW